MAKKKEFYKSKTSGLILNALTDGEVGEELELLVANSVDAAVEKHVPVIEKIDGGYKVTVGSVIHPMETEHYIQWIQLDEGDKVQIKLLNPGEDPIAEFKSDASSVKAYEYCNLHGLWIKE